MLNYFIWFLFFFVLSNLMSLDDIVRLKHLLAEAQARADAAEAQLAKLGQSPRVMPLTVGTSPLRIGYQGEAGAYSEAAIREYMSVVGILFEVVPFASFELVFKAVESGDVDRAMLPIENSLGGSIHANYDLMLRFIQ